MLVLSCGGPRIGSRVVQPSSGGMMPSEAAAATAASRLTARSMIVKI